VDVELSIRIRLNAQAALLTHVTPQMRAASVDADAERRLLLVRFVFDGEPSESVRDAASCAATEMIAHLSGDWMIDEQYVNCPAPTRIEHLRYIVYHRCEDEWVRPRA
jgi:hypothetical protein